MKVTVEYTQGDVVFLKSDGCLETSMTVEFADDEDVSVVWVSEHTGEVKRETFPSACLMTLDC